MEGNELDGANGVANDAADTGMVEPGEGGAGEQEELGGQLAGDDGGAADEDSDVGAAGAGGDGAFSVADLLGGDPPVAWMKKFEEDGAGTFSVDPKDLEDIPEAAKMQLWNMRKGFQKGMDHNAEQRKQLEQMASDLKAYREETERSMQGFIEMMRAGNVIPEVDANEKPPDVWDPEYPAWAAKQAIARELDNWKQNMTSHIEEQERRRESERAEAARASRVAQIEEFAKQNPDFDDYVDRIKEYRSKHGDVPAEDVYYLLKRSEEKSKADSLQRSRDASRRARPGSTGRAPKAPPSGLTGRELYEWYDQNPEATAETFRSIRH